MTEIVIANTGNKHNILQEVVSGEAFEAFLQSKKATPTRRGLSDIGAYNLRSSSADILNHCNPHDAASNLETTHLVVGYVQSGKTMSFTGVLAMAKDNGYRVAVILTGVTTNLLMQTSDRLEGDLDLNEDQDWFRFINSPSSDDALTLVKALRLSDKPMIIIPILKHAKYINDLAGLFASDSVKSTMGNETVLIIDDEADQASLNSYGYKNSKITDPDEVAKESAIYKSIHNLRAQLPGNSYIQYTATPQANILITTADILSPKSHTLLTPGEDYVGGKKFFGQEKDGTLFNGGLIKEIPENEVYHKKHNVLKQMPASLKEAMMLHVWAVILVIKWYRRPGIKQLTMMVHPTDIIDGNKTFEEWIRNELNLWSECFNKPVWHEDRVMLLHQFKNYFDEAVKFYPELGRPTFEQIAPMIPDIVNDCAIYRITGESDDDGKTLKWNSHRMNILVGAQMLNRGFTVEKLATTYMPRYTTSITNADTIEQRCRFFGYKMDYIESCRVYLPKKSKEDYISYVKHEEELRGLLATCSTLKDYEHRVMLSPSLRPTRLNVLPKQLVKTKLVGWAKYERINGGKMIADNRNVVSAFVNKFLTEASDFETAGYNSSKYPTGEIKKHSMALLKSSDVVEMLTDYLTGSFAETLSKSMAIRYIQYLETLGHGDIMVVFMSCNNIRKRTLRDTANKDGKMVPLFQGRSNINEPDNYCGDTNIICSDYITLQIHHLSVEGLPVSEVQNKETYGIALHFPEKLKTIYCSTIANEVDLSEE